MHLASRFLLNATALVGCGMGASRLRLMNPTSFSTEPFSWPEFGLQNEYAKS